VTICDYRGDPLSPDAGGISSLKQGAARGAVIIMPAKLTYDSLADVPDGIQEFAKEGDDGKYVVVVDGAERVKEFREKNIEISKERDGLNASLAQYEQVTGVALPDLEEGKLSDFAKTLETLRDTKKKVEDGNLVENTSLEEAAAARVTDVTNSFKTQLAEIAKDRDAHKTAKERAEQRANAMQVENTVRLAAADPDIAMIDKAVTFVLPKALQTFRVEGDGTVTPKTSDGTVIYGSDGVTPMSMKEWLLKERSENDFLFQGSKGGGASGNADKASGRLTQAQLDAMSPQEKMKYARKHGL